MQPALHAMTPRLWRTCGRSNTHIAACCGIRSVHSRNILGACLVPRPQAMLSAVLTLILPGLPPNSQCKGHPVSPSPRSLPDCPPVVLDRPAPQGSLIHGSITPPLAAPRPAAALCPHRPATQLSPTALTNPRIYLAECPWGRGVRRPTVSAPSAQPGPKPKDGTPGVRLPGLR